MKDTISFSVPGSNSIHEMQVGLTLIRFIGFDLKYFGEQCAQIYRKSLSAGEDSLAKALAFKELLRTCHPYCATLLHSEFDKIALDCMIEYMCTREGAGLEELWVRNLSASDRFGRALFERITEYKTGHAINQWINLVRLQSYAASKADVIYGGPEAEPSVHKARKLYYDTAFRLTASALGFGSGDLPYMKVSSVPFLPDATDMLKNAVNTLEPVIKKRTESVEARDPLKGKDCVRDQMAGMALNAMMDMKRPEVDEILQMIQNYRDLPNTVYEPAGFKALLDLEFDQLIERGFYLRTEGKGYTRLKYSARREIPAEKPEAPAANSEPAEVASTPEPEFKPPAGKKIMPAISVLADLYAPAEEKQTETPEPPANIKNIVADLGPGKTGTVRTIIEMAEDPNRKESKKRTLQEVNMRCNLIWTSMNVRSGWGISSEEASEWFRYLTRLRYGIGTGDLTPSALDKFLDATLEVYRILPDNE